MRSRLKALLVPPVFPADDDKTIAAAMIHYGIGFGLIANIIHIPALLFSHDPPARVLLTTSLMISVLLLNLFFLRRGFVRSSGAAFIFLGWIILGMSNYTAGGVRAPGFVIQIVFIICLAFVLGGRGAFLGATLSSLLGLLFMSLEERGLLPAPHVDNTPGRHWFIYSAAFFIIAAILAIMVNRLRKTLAEARRELRAREETERQLELHQAHLEETVRERTVALAETNKALLKEVQERRLAEEELRRERDFIGQLMETSPVGILVIDTERRFTFANSAAAQVLGRRREEIMRLGCTDEEWHFTDHRGQPLPAQELPFLQAMNEGVTVRNASVAVERADGERAFLSVNAAPLKRESDRPRGCVVTVEDVSERMRLEQEILRTQKLESVGVLAGGIAHDFNNLLTAIMGNISLARMELPGGHPLGECLADAEKASLQARELTQQLLTFSRGGTPVKQLVAIGEIVTDATQFILRGANVRADYAIAPDLWAVEADQGQLGQVFHNLGINACQAMPGGGTVRIEAANVEIGGGNSLQLPPGKYVRVRVTDHGVGIAPEHREKVFDPFFTTKGGGTGLGLAVAYSVVRNHGGHIGVESQVGKGTAFTVYLPAAAGAARAPAPPARTYTGQGRILLMDDEPVVRQVVSRILTALGYEAQAAPEGGEALELYRDALERGRPFDAVILDLTVPGGMGGIETIRQLRVIDPAVRAIVSSGYSSDPVMSSYQDYGFCSVIAKPYQANDLSRVLHKVLDAR